MACSLILELQGREANNKSPSNFDRLRAVFGHVLISISLTTNMLLARLALYNTAAVSSASSHRDHHSGLWVPRDDMQEKAGSSEDSSTPSKVRVRLPVALSSDFIFLWQRLVKEKCSSWKTHHNLKPFTVQIQGCQTLPVTLNDWSLFEKFQVFIWKQATLPVSSN